MLYIGYLYQKTLNRLESCIKPVLPIFVLYQNCQCTAYHRSLIQIFYDNTIQFFMTLNAAKKNKQNFYHFILVYTFFYSLTDIQEHFLMLNVRNCHVVLPLCHLLIRPPYIVECSTLFVCI